MEQITDKVDILSRTTSLGKLLLDKQGVPVSDIMEDIRDYVAPLIEQAYLAGYNNVNISAGMPRKRIEDTGQPLANARAFVKDKGFRI